MLLSDSKKVVERFLDAQDNLVIQASDLSLKSIVDMVQSNAIDINPHYQRRERWSILKQSALIESFILNVPVPPIYLSEDDYGKYSVIDGKQRITSIVEFFTDRLQLKSLRDFPELEGHVFSNLPVQIQNALSVRPYLRVVTLLRQTNPDLKYEVFLRLNTGGEKLKPQEIRNVAFSGPLNDLLFELAENNFLKSKLKIYDGRSVAYRNMEDVEYVLRFFTILDDSWHQIGKSLSIAMDFYMEKMRRPPINEIINLRNIFLRAIDGCERIWAGHAFNRPYNGGWRDQLISPLYDAQMVAVAILSDDAIERAVERRADVLEMTQQLFEDDDTFKIAVGQGTNNPINITYRINAISNILTEVSRG